MISAFNQFRKKVIVSYTVGDVTQDFTLLEPSAHSRNQYLLACEEKASELEVKKNPNAKKTVNGEVDTSDISFKKIAENEEMSLYLIALCMYESLPETTTHQQCWDDLKLNVNDKFIEKFYPIAESLIFPKAPTDALNPKLDQGSNLHTD